MTTYVEREVITLRTDFASGGLLDVGYRSAGMTPVFAVEMDAAKCEVYRANLGDHIVCAKVEDVLPGQTPGEVAVYHASTSCKNVSIANTSGIETQEDLSAARAVVRNIKALRPKVFTFENVRQYEKTRSFLLVKSALTQLGYRVAHHVVCAADYGVPQTRRRLILVATRSDMPLFEWPEPTHHNGFYLEETNLFGTKVRQPWVGWYEAVADLIPALEDDRFADWQLDRLPQELKTLALLVDCKNNNKEFSAVPRPAHKPAQTVVAIGRPANLPRAFLVDGRNTDQRWGRGYREDRSPCHTLTRIDRPSHMPRALLVDCTHRTDGTLTVREKEESAFTITASHLRREASTPRAWLDQGRIVRMSVRALARFQSMPDEYQFTGNNSLDCAVIGDGVPCKLAEVFGREIVRLFR